jgi:predicted PurR-regulated permease PerM
MTSVLFVVFLSLIFGFDFMYGSDQGAQIIQSVTHWLDWFFSLLKHLIDWGEAVFGSSTSTA